MINSFLSDQLGTNYAPTPAETLLLRQELSASRKRVLNIEKETSQAQGRLSDLNRQRDAVEAELRGLQAILSPARRLIPEILQEIFTRCLPTDRNPVMSSKEGPLLLGRICQVWRGVAYSTPALWSSIHIAIPSDSFYAYTCSHSVWNKAIVDWLSLSGTCPLSISLSVPEGDYLGSSTALDSTVAFYLKSISSFLPRCQSICFLCPTNGPWNILLDKCATSPNPLLKHIHFDLGSGNGNPATIGDVMKTSPMFSSPMLESVILSHYGPRAIHLPIRWGQLTLLKLFDKPGFWDSHTALSIRDALLLLSWCQSLVFCAIPLSETNSSLPDSHAERAPTIVSLPQLVGFSVQCDIDPKLFYLNLSAPSLRYLQHHQHQSQSLDAYMNGEDRALYLSLGPFIRRVVQPVEEFEIISTTSLPLQTLFNA
ncbi:hypothetical protein NP233_g5329 [Leucocoprinus birnbaumii]|uniref:F-box domain-containing protein n=1 Tax=Leucocoprinus birnbaumii TaxID=56174 RepID=A0AAD5VWR2_9AGAR|nr:hypothetical protein NP233_g5329 [Leucocoprinus birnbaumii]